MRNLVAAMLALAFLVGCVTTTNNNPERNSTTLNKKHKAPLLVSVGTKGDTGDLLCPLAVISATNSCKAHETDPKDRACRDLGKWITWKLSPHIDGYKIKELKLSTSKPDTSNGTFDCTHGGGWNNGQKEFKCKIINAADQDEINYDIVISKSDGTESCTLDPTIKIDH